MSKNKKNNVPIARKIEDKTEVVEYKKSINKKHHPIVNFFLFLSLVSSVLGFVITLIYKEDAVDMTYSFISSLLLVIFTLLFVASSIANNNRKKGIIAISSLVLILFNCFYIGTTMSLINLPSFNKMEDFTGKSLTEVVDWASSNNINLEQYYEYSDMIDEYKIISQDVKAGKNIKDVKNLTVAVSEGASPNKDVIVPSMIGWDSERVLKFIKKNYLSNVIVEFVESDKAEDTVIEQSKNGNLKRNEEIKLTFSLGEGEKTDVKLIDLTNKTKFEAEFYLKQHRIDYEFNDDFSNKIQRGKVMKQSKKSGTIIKADSNEKIKVTISRGKKIVVPDLSNMSITEITNWIIKNRLKLEITDRYDEKIKDNKVIEANHKKGGTIEQGSLISLVISKGKLVMPNFKSLSAFLEWAQKYNIKYEEKHEFSENVEAGKIISFSHKTGDTIKNNDTVTVTISDGKKCEVPDLKGMSKNDIISKLKKLDLNYNFIYQASNSVAKDNAISQSISAGSSVSKGTTITVTLSNGKKETSSSSSNKSSSSNGKSSNNTKSNSNSGSSASKPSCDTSKGAYFFLGAGNTGSQVYESTKSQNPGFSISVNYVSSCSNGATTSGMVCNSSSYDEKWISYCTAIKLTIVK